LIAYKFVKIHKLQDVIGAFDIYIGLYCECVNVPNTIDRINETAELPQIFIIDISLILGLSKAEVNSAEAGRRGKGAE